LLAQRLRAAGVSADALARQASRKAQFKAADRRGARFAVVLDDDEEGTVVRNMEDGTESSVPLSELATWLQT